MNRKCDVRRLGAFPPTHENGASRRWVETTSPSPSNRRLAHGSRPWAHPGWIVLLAAAVYRERCRETKETMKNQAFLHVAGTDELAARCSFSDVLTAQHGRPVYRAASGSAADAANLAEPPPEPRNPTCHRPFMNRVNCLRRIIYLGKR